MKERELVLVPEEAFDQDRLREIIREKLNFSPNEPFEIIKRSIDARSKPVKIRVRIGILENGESPQSENYSLQKYPDISEAKTKVVIIGAGPAGLFAALELIELGIKPIILERGKDVRTRRRDLADINKKHIVNSESNYCFGEGGAGTYSDGKLYTRSKKRGDIQKILEMLVAFGAREDILFDAHPHIGTNKLPKIIQKIREFILAKGGAIKFDTKVTDFIVENDQLKKVVVENGDIINADAFILATGHSARDIFEKLHHKNITIEAKPSLWGSA